MRPPTATYRTGGSARWIAHHPPSASVLAVARRAHHAARLDNGASLAAQEVSWDLAWTSSGITGPAAPAWKSQLDTAVSGPDPVAESGRSSPCWPKREAAGRGTLPSRARTSASYGQDRLLPPGARCVRTGNLPERGRRWKSPDRHDQQKTSPRETGPYQQRRYSPSSAPIPVRSTAEVTQNSNNLTSLPGWPDGRLNELDRPWNWRSARRADEQQRHLPGVATPERGGPEPATAKFAGG